MVVEECALYEGDDVVDDDEAGVLRGEEEDEKREGK